jgi:hypothetical protein
VFASSTLVRAAWRRDHVEQSPARAAAATPAAVLEAAVTLKSTGASTGQAFTLEVVNPTGQPLKVAVREGLVVEAVQAQPGQPPAPGTSLVREGLNAYCLDFTKPPPPAGVTYRMADTATQQKFRPMRNVLRAARRLQQAGKLTPDALSDATAYLDATKQWSLWSKLQGWGEKQFADAFLDRTKKNLEQLKVSVTKDIENQIKGLIPGRWKSVQLVLAEADRLARQPAGAR